MVFKGSECNSVITEKKIPCLSSFRTLGLYFYRCAVDMKSKRRIGYFDVIYSNKSKAVYVTEVNKSKCFMVHFFVKAQAF